MNKLKAIIVDDERSAISTLSGMLGKFCPQVEVAAESTSVEDALLAIREHEPQVVFLDIELPPFGKGFDLITLMPERNFGVIFTTAYPQYAIQAINNVQPWGYLVKPFRVADLVLAVQTAQEKSASKSSKPEVNESQGILVPDQRKGNIVVPVRQILYCKADGSTTDIFVLQNDKIQKITGSFTLKVMEQQLPPTLFCRTHHSYLVNLAQILRYEKVGRSGIIHMPHDIKVEISVLKMESFETTFRAYLNL